MATLLKANRTFSIAAACIFTAGLMTFSLVKEPPLGSLQGRVVAAESGRPLSGAYISLIPVNSNDSREKSYKSSVDGTFKITTLPAGDYRISMDTPAHQLPSTLITIEEGKSTVFDAELSPKPSFMELVVHQHVYTPEEKPLIACKGFIQADDVRLTIYKADMDTLLKSYGGDLARMLNPKYSYSWEADRRYNPQAANGVQLLRTSLQPVNRRDVEGIFYQRIPLDSLAPGMYVLKVQADGVEKYDWLMVTDLALVTKQVGNTLFAYTADIITGRPVGGTVVEAYEGNKLVGSSPSDPSGICLQSLTPSTGGESNRLIIARNGDSTAFTSSYIYQQEGRKARTIYAYTDRPVYRPEQTVYYKGIVRRFDTDRYVTPPPEPVEVEVQDAYGNILHKVTTKTNRFGSYYGNFDLPKGAATGYYSISARVAGVRQETGFEVAEYRKPEFSAEVKPVKSRYTRGDTIEFRVSASYYFGAPVVKAPVKYTVTRDPYWFSPDEQEEFTDYDFDYEYEDYGGYGEEVMTGEVRTDNQGVAYIRVPAKWESGEYEDFNSDQQYSVNISISDASRREAYADASVTATRGMFAVVSSPQSYICQPGKQTSVNIRTINYNRKPVGEAVVKVTAGKQDWTGNEVKFKSEEQAELTTDNNGRAVFTFSPRETGQYKVVCESRDDRGNIIRNSSYLWVTGETSGELDYKYPELDIVPDKKIYAPGDTAKVLINSEHSGVMALVTVEGERLFDYRLVELKGKSTVVDIPIKGSYRPNAYINVGYIRNKEFVQRQEPVRVTLQERRLNVSIKSDKSRYLPGERALYRVKVTDAVGQPVSAELSLGVVDEAIYAVRRDNTPPPVDFFYRRQYNGVRTDFSFPQVYLSAADKGGFAGKVRRRFVDTAFWNPAVITNSRGEAVVSFDMPDNLTTWRATVRAVTPDTTVGDAISTALCTKDLLVRLETPRFFTQNDESEISGFVHNYTKDRQTVSVSLRCSNLKVSGRMDRKVAVAPGGSEQITWKVETPRSGECEAALYAEAGRLSDAMKLTIPVHPHGQEKTRYYTGVVPAGRSSVQKIEFSPDSIREADRIVIRLSPSLAGTMMGSLDYLAGYPYGCTEQTMSRFLPDVVLWKSLKELGVSKPELARELPQMVNAGLLKLYSHQHEDGGWGWYEFDESDTWMTSYVVYGLVTAREAGFPVNADILSRGIAVLRNKTLNKQSKDRLAQDTFALYALSMVGADPELEARILRSYQDMNGISDQGLAFLSLALDRIGRNEEAKTVLNSLISRANESAAFLYWTSSSTRTGETANETGAAALMAAVTVDPQNPAIPKIVNRIMKERRGNHWESTRDTAMALYGLSMYLRNTRELGPKLSVTVTCNGRQAASVYYDKESLFKPEQEIVLDKAAVKPGLNKLEIRTAGRGNLYYAIRSEQFVARKQIPQTLTSSGIRIKREYYRLVPEWNEQMLSTSFVPASKPTEEFRTGSPIRVRLTVYSPRSYDYVLIEDMLPAGCEAVDTGRKYSWEWRNWWAAEDIRDDRVSFYADQLPAGRSVIEYEIRPLTFGRYNAMPCEVYSMYDPDIYAASSENRINLR